MAKTYFLMKKLSIIIANATESLAGIIEIANNTEALAASDDTRAMTPLKTKALIDFLASATSGFSPARIESYKALANISVGQHTYLKIMKDQPIATNTIYNLTTTGNFGVAFSNSKRRRLLKATAQYQGNRVSGTPQYILEGRLYAATGTPGSGATATGSALATSSSQIQSFSSGSGFIDFSQTYEFEETYLNANTNYVFQINLTSIIGTSASLNVRGLNSAVANTNFLENNVASNSEAMAITLYFDDGDEVVLSNSTLTTGYRYGGKATETKLANQQIAIQTRGAIVETGAAYGDVFFATDTPGTIATTPGTNLHIVAIGSTTNSAVIRGEADLNNSDVVINTLFTSTPSGASTPFLSAGGGLLKFKVRSSSGQDRTLSIQVSIDNITWDTISYEVVPFSGGGDGSPIRRILIEPNKYVRFTFTTSAGVGSADILSRFIPF